MTTNDITDLADELRDGSRRGTATCVMAAATLDALAQENERLRNALQAVADGVLPRGLIDEMVRHALAPDDAELD
jgi:hypothetical protein